MREDRENNDDLSKNIFEYNFEGKKIVFEFDKLAFKSNKSILCRYENSVVLTTLMVRKRLERNYTFFPLTVFFDERFYAAGRIPNIFNKREVRGSHNSVKNARLIDRFLRGFFPIGSDQEVQISNIVLSSGKECNSLLAAIWNSFLVCYLSEDFLYFNEDDCSAAIMVTTSKSGETFVCHDICGELSGPSSEVIIGATEKNKILLLEARVDEVSEEKMKKIVDFSFQKIKLLIGFFHTVRKTIKGENISHKQLEIKNKDEKSLFEFEENLKTKMQEKVALVLSSNNISWLEKERKLKQSLLVFLEENFSENPELLKEKGINYWEEVWNFCLKQESYSLLIKNQTRLDSRKAGEIRSLKMEIDFLPNKVHGSALFQRGNTQVLSSITIGKASERQIISILPIDKTKYFIHHYNFPSFSVGEMDSSRSVSRREVGHGELVEKTFFSLLPSINNFPHTIRVVSEVLSSDGSSSQASICATSLALFSSGVPLKSLAAGVSLGMINKKIIVDINALEDKLGDMDFKIAGTEKGICSIQLDTTKGVDISLLDECFSKAKEARMQILNQMKKCLSNKTALFSPTAGKSRVISADPRYIGSVIGLGGATINSLKKTGASIEMQVDGTIFVYHHDENELNNVCDSLINIIMNARRR